MKKLLLAAALACSSWLAHAVDMPISAQDALAKVQQADSPVLFIDVRDPVEIMFVGFTDAVHANIPFMLVDRTRWNADKGLVVEPHKRHAQPNGWRNSGLPWSARMNPAKIHRIDQK